MDINKFSGLISTICVFALLHSSLGSELVPVFMWGSPKSTEIVPAVTQVNKATFTEILFEKIKKNNPQIIVFAEQSLSPEDFRDQPKKTYEEISKLSANNELTYLPLVEDPVYTIEDLPAKDIAEISITDISSAKDIPDASIVIVSLDDAEDDEDRTDMLRRHDAIVSKLYKELVKHHSEILVLFTGFHSSWIMPDQIKNHRQSRSLADNPKANMKQGDTRVFLNSSMFGLFLNNSIQIVIPSNGTKKIEYYEITSLTYENDTNVIEGRAEGESENDSKEVNTFVLNTNTTETFTLTLKSEGGYWRLEKIEAAIDNGTFIPKNAYAPAGFSYHCSSMNLEKVNSSTMLKLIGLQIQYGKNFKNKFDDAYDCVGFTTVPIWSGLFVTFILALIMTLGLTMMMDIKTMDRFDDPKGKTIIINAAE